MFISGTGYPNKNAQQSMLLHCFHNPKNSPMSANLKPLNPAHILSVIVPPPIIIHNPCSLPSPPIQADNNPNIFPTKFTTS